jgi:hypothetical protein
MINYDELMKSPVNRRAFLTRMWAAGLGASAVSLLSGGLLSGCGGSGSDRKSNSGFDSGNFPGIAGRSSDEVVLNYALTLENLEADLYRQALNIASGRDIAAPLEANPPTNPASTGSYSLAINAGGLAPEFVFPAFLYLVQYAYVEAAHRDFLSVALQSLGAPITPPNPKGYKAAFGDTLETLMVLLAGIEETGVRAYLGAAPFMTNVQLLTTAVAIHSTEARHSGAIAYILGRNPGPTYLPGDRNALDQKQTPNPSPYSENTFQYYLEPKVVLNAVRQYIIL